MPRAVAPDFSGMWERHHAQWRSQAQVASLWEQAAAVDPILLGQRTRGRFWEALAAAGVTLLVGREYEHLLMALRVDRRGPAVSFLPVPHPSGVAVDRVRGVVHVACTRNPNQILELEPVAGHLKRADAPPAAHEGRPLVPTVSRFLPGCLYLHDLAVVGGVLHGTAVGENCVVRLAGGVWSRAWWPKAVERRGRPQFSRNFLQLNSVAAGSTLERSCFTASTARMGRRVPGQVDFKVDRQGVLFSGATREVVLSGLTRPHSARWHRRKVWIANSGYGELGVADGDRFTVVRRLPGWTRGLCFAGQVAFVATSRVIPRFRAYAPGLAVDRSECGVHAVDTRTGALLGSLVWPAGNQVFAVEWLPQEFTTGLPFTASPAGLRGERPDLFYSFLTARTARRVR